MLQPNFTKLIGIEHNMSFYDLYEQLEFKKKHAKFLELDNATFTGKLPKWFEQYKGKNLTINYSEDNSQTSLLSVRNIILAKAPNTNNEVIISPILPNLKSIRIINGNYQFDNISEKLDYLHIENANCNLDLATFNVKTVSIMVSELEVYSYGFIVAFKNAIKNPNVKRVYLTIGDFPDVGPSTAAEILHYGSKIIISAKSYPEWFRKLSIGKLKATKIRY